MFAHLIVLDFIASVKFVQWYGIFFYFLVFALKKSKKQSLYTPWRRLGGEGYSSYSITTSALDWGEWSESRPGRALTPGKEPPVPIIQEAGWAPEPVWTQRLEEKSSVPAGDRTPIALSSSP
jgi:hypothetical protein